MHLSYLILSDSSVAKSICTFLAKVLYKLISVFCHIISLYLCNKSPNLALIIKIFFILSNIFSQTLTVSQHKNRNSLLTCCNRWLQSLEIEEERCQHDEDLVEIIKKLQELDMRAELSWLKWVNSPNMILHTFPTLLKDYKSFFNYDRSLLQFCLLLKIFSYKKNQFWVSYESLKFCWLH